MKYKKMIEKIIFFVTLGIWIYHLVSGIICMYSGYIYSMAVDNTYSYGISAFICYFFDLFISIFFSYKFFIFLFVFGYPIWYLFFRSDTKSRLKKVGKVILYLSFIPYAMCLYYSIIDCIVDDEIIGFFGYFLNYFFDVMIDFWYLLVYQLWYFIFMFKPKKESNSVKEKDKEKGKNKDNDRGSSKAKLYLSRVLLGISVFCWVSYLGLAVIIAFTGISDFHGNMYYGFKAMYMVLYDNWNLFGPVCLLSFIFIIFYFIKYGFKKRK